MLNKKYASLATLAGLMLSASAAMAGTKVQVNLVPTSATDPPTNPTISESKSKLQLTDKGLLQVALSEVKDAGGVLVTTSTAYNDAIKACVTPPCLTLDGSEYMVIVTVGVPALAPGPVGELIVPVDLKAGKGKTKISAGALIGLLPPGLGRSLAFYGAEVWGPLGANLAACTALLGAGPAPNTGVSVAIGDPSCRGGDQLGVAGINIP